MESVAFAIPLKAGSSARLQEALAEFTSGRAGDYAERERHGLRALRAWYQAEPAEMLIVYLEAEDLEQFMIGSSLSDEPMQDWLENVLDELTDADLPDVDRVVDWRAGVGHQVVEAPRSA
jgi:hypothetical protein